MTKIVHIDKILLTPFGEAESDLEWISDSPDSPTEFSCWIIETGENWWFPQPLVRAVISMSAPRRGEPSPIVMTDDLLHRYAVHILRHKKSQFRKQALDFLDSPPEEAK